MLDICTRGSVASAYAEKTETSVRLLFHAISLSDDGVSLIFQIVRKEPDRYDDAIWLK
jgi:hypothetical protein